MGTEGNSPTTMKPLHTFSNPVSFKLDVENFLTWRQQAMSAIKGHKLKDYLKKEKVPKRFASEEDRLADKETEEYEHWEQQDQLLVTWLLASMSESLHTMMVRCEYAYEIWQRIEVWYLSHTRAKIKQLKLQLKNVKKEGSSMNKYLQQVKKLVDSLAAVGSPLDVEDHIEAIFDGLSEEYDPFITSVTSRIDPYTVQEIESLLMAQEERLEKHKKLDLGGMQANVAQRKGTGDGNDGNSGFGRGSFNPHGSRGGRRGRGRFGRGGRWNQGRPQCQVCGKMGHLAWNCYQRFNQDYPNPFPSQNAVNPPPSAAFHNPSQQRSQMQAYLSQQDTSSAQTYLATPSTVYDPIWYPDSGASNHITLRRAKLNDSITIYGTRSSKNW